MAGVESVKMGRSVQMVLVSLALILILAPCHASAHSMKNRVDPQQPLSRINLHRQLTALNSAVSISVPNGTLGLNVRTPSSHLIFSQPSQRG